MTQRLLPPGSTSPASITVNGRLYTCAVGSTVDVPDQDAYIMMANGWIPAAPGAGGEGATGVRPASPTAGQSFFDTTLAKGIVFDGSVWCDPDTGLAV